jgi:hypothetical protein
MSTLQDEIALQKLLAPLASVKPVRRGLHRQRNRRGLLTAVAVACAGAVTLAAVAATNGWIFTRGSNMILGYEHVQFRSKPYTFGVRAAVDGRSFDLILSRGDLPDGIGHPKDILQSARGGSVLAQPGIADLILPPPKPIGPAFGAVNYNQGGGQIWFGDARPTITRIAITDNHGHVFRAATSVPPSNIKLSARLWVVVLPESTGAMIAGYDSHGTLIDRRPIWGLAAAMYLH